MIYLPSIKTLVYTVEKNKERQNHIVEMMNKLKFANWSFIYGVANRRAYWIAIHDDFIRFLSEENSPFLFLEDDATLTEHYKEEIEYPEDADLVYLGGTTNGEHFKQKNVDNSCRSGNMVYTEYNDEYIRIWNMHSTHAILFIKNDVNQQIKDVINWAKERCPTDVAIAMHMHKWKVYCRKLPFWYQNDDRNSCATQKYYP
jgi:hypothetical protein